MAEKGKYCKLIMVTASNNNKYYEMREVNGQLEVTYGRVESTAVNKTYPMSRWNSLYNSKVKKGYKDVTDLVSVEVDENTKEPVAPSKDNISIIEDAIVRDFMSKMNAYTNNLVKKTYSVKADSVSQAQVDKAQKLINALLKLDPDKDESKINEKLLELYTVIPRYMSNTRVMLLPHIDFEKTMQQEQDNLDAMASKVHLIKKEKEAKAKLAKKNKSSSKTKKEKLTSILDELGVSMSEGKVTKELKYLVEQIEKQSGYRVRGTKIKAVLDVDKPAEDAIFDDWMKKQKNKETRYLIHGTRCTSVIPIIEQGLKIRPSGNFQFSGKAYGDGNYFSELVEKSLGYVGYDSDKVLLVYEVHTGKPFVYKGWYRGNNFKLCYSELQKRGFDSTHVEAGGGLQMSEIIAYKEEQCKLKHILWLT